MGWDSVSFLLLLAFLVAGLCSHIMYMDKMHKRISVLSNIKVSKNRLYMGLSIPHGSNFNSVAISAWILFFIALAYLYFLTPAVFDRFNYFRLPVMASSPFGFLVFATWIFLLTVLVSAYLPRIYSFYEISKGFKTAILLPSPLLVISLLCSAYIGTIYPMFTSLTDLAWKASFLTLLISELVLLSPIFIGYAEVNR